MKILKWILLLVIGVPIVFIAGAYVRNKAVGPVGWAEDNTLKRLKAKMKDPDSMVVRSSYTLQRMNASKDVEIFVCGVVDGKNSYGGYTGGNRFASKSVSSQSNKTFDTYSVELEDPEQAALAKSVKMLSAFDKVYWNDYCVDADHPAIAAEK
jgi:hypothetical protein